MFSSEVKPAQAEQLLLQRNLRAEDRNEASRQTYKVSVKTKGIRVGGAGRRQDDSPFLLVHNQA